MTCIHPSLEFFITMYRVRSQLVNLKTLLIFPLEFTPYVFQLFAALLEARPQGPLSEFYKALIAPVLMPAPWESRGNIPALSRLLSSIIPRSAADIVANNQVEPILGIFQKLMSGKTRTELYSFDILEAIITSCDV
jgi:exportin-2 (importin alpha re-exporter)